MGIVTAYKSIGSDEGQMSYMGLEAKWKEYIEELPKVQETKNQTIYYGY